MSKTLCLLVVALMLGCAPSRAEKITVDPNALGAQVAVKTAAQEEIDPRLLQEITYTSGYKRLHVVVEDLSRIGGVDIGCGNNKKDWRVRHIPVVVCVKDMPLGKLLQAIADATHLRLASEKVGDDPKKSYRIYRDGLRARQLQAFFDNRIAEQMAKEEQSWETMLLLKDISSEQFIRETGFGDDTFLCYCKIVSELGSGLKDGVFNGESVELTHDSLSSLARTQFDNAAKSLWHSRQESDAQFHREHPGSEVTNEPIGEFDTTALGKCSLVIGPEFGGGGDGGVIFTLKTPAGNRRMAAHDASWIARELKGVKVPEIKAQEDRLPPEYERLASAEGKWQSLPGLDEEVKIGKWTSASDPTPSDFAQALADASGIAIIYEDFFSHGESDVSEIHSMFGTKAKVIDLLNRFRRISSDTTYTPRWLYNEKDRVLVGWAEKWQFRHSNLVEAGFLDRLKTLINGSGIELDDYLPAMLLSEDEEFEWIHTDPDLNRLAGARSRGPVWELYAQLKAEDRLLAQSDAGVPIVKVAADPAQVIKEQNTEIASGSDPEGSPPKLISSATTPDSLAMRVREEPARSKGKRTYVIELLDTNHEVVHRIGINESFPIYSKKREAEIAKTPADKKK